jgi:hypothetical protein
VTAAHESAAQLPAPQNVDPRPVPGAPAVRQNAAGAFEALFDPAKLGRVARGLFLDPRAFGAQEHEGAADRHGAFDQPIGR